MGGPAPCSAQKAISCMPPRASALATSSPGPHLCQTGYLLACAVGTNHSEERLPRISPAGENRCDLPSIKARALWSNASTSRGMWHGSSMSRMGMCVPFLPCASNGCDALCHPTGWHFRTHHM